MITEERKVNLRRKAGIDVLPVCPPDKEEALFWLQEMTKYVHYMFGGLPGAMPAFTRDEKIDAAKALAEDESTPAPVLTLVKAG